mgnify:CR=1 FL=1
MAEPDKQQFGDGGDQWGEAARNLANAAKDLGKEGVKSAASGTAAGVANSSAALVKAGVEGGKAISEIAAGTAAGGPWGAVLSAAWSLRHTLYKIWCASACFPHLIILLTSLPTIVTNQVFGLNGADMTNPLTLSQSMTKLSGVVADALEVAHQAALERVNVLISEGRLRPGALPGSLGRPGRGHLLRCGLRPVRLLRFHGTTGNQPGGYGKEALQPGRQAVPRHLRGEDSRGTGGKL